MHGAEARNESLEVAQIMSLIRQVQNPLVLRQAIPVDIQRIERPIGVVRSEHDELRCREAVAVAVGIDDRDELAAGGRVDPLGQLDVRIIADLFREAAECLALQVDLGRDVEHGDDHGRDARYTRLDSREQPRGPATLRCARDRKSLDRNAPALLGELLDRVHCPRGALDHGKQQRPVRLARL